MRGLKLILVLLAVSVAAFIMWKQVTRPSISIEQIQRDSASLAKQELKFLSRGHDFAHYDLFLISTAGDTVKGYYRVPANTRKLPALIWLYDSQSGVDAKSMLDRIPESGHCAIIAFNCFTQFEHRSDGSLDRSDDALSQGLLKSKRAVELFVQFLKKHHVVDSSLVYAGGEGIGIASLISAASGSTGRARGFIFAEPLDDQLAELFAKNEIVSLLRLSSKVFPTPCVLVTNGTARLKELLPSHWGCELVSMKPVAAGEAGEINAALKSGLEWILKANPVKDDVPGLTDSTRVFNVRK